MFLHATGIGGDMDIKLDWLQFVQKQNFSNYETWIEKLLKIACKMLSSSRT